MIVALIFTCHPARVCMWFTLKYFFSISVSMLLYLLHKAWRSSASFIQKKQKLFHLILVFPKQSRINRSNSNLGASFAQNHLMFVPKIYEWHLGFSLEFRIMHLHTGNLFDYLASDHRNGQWLPFSFSSHLSLEGNRFKYFLLPSVNQTSI